MSTSLTSDDLQALVKFPFEDPKWKSKLGIGSLVMLAGFIIPIVPILFLYGYCAQIMRSIIVDRKEPFLPEWDDWGKLFMDGLKIFGITIIYSLPFILLMIVGYAVFFATMMLPAFTYNPDSGSNPGGFIPVIGMIIWLGTFGVGMLLMLAISLILPVTVTHAIATDEFSAAFKVGEWWHIFTANIGGFLIAYVILAGFWIALTVVLQVFYITIVLCCLVPFIIVGVYIYMMIIGSVMFGQAYRDGVDVLNAKPALTNKAS